MCELLPSDGMISDAGIMNEMQRPLRVHTKAKDHTVWHSRGLRSQPRKRDGKQVRSGCQLGRVKQTIYPLFIQRPESRDAECQISRVSEASLQITMVPYAISLLRRLVCVSPALSADVIVSTLRLRADRKGEGAPPPPPKHSDGAIDHRSRRNLHACMDRFLCTRPSLSISIPPSPAVSVEVCARKTQWCMYVSTDVCARVCACVYGVVAAPSWRAQMTLTQTSAQRGAALRGTIRRW